MHSFISMFGRGAYLPHGYCLSWAPGLLWSFVAADVLIALAYFSIPLVILGFVRARPDLSMKGVAWLFSAFIFACGLTHALDVWTLWQPDYAVLALSKLFTAAISVVTAMALWPLLPKALAIPSVRQLQAAIVRLEAEVLKRQTVESHLIDVQQSLALTLASIGAGFIACDRAGRVSAMNVVAEQVLGWPLAEARGQSIWTVFEREDRPASARERNAVDIVIERNWTVDDVHRIVAISRSGKRTPLEVKLGLTRGENDSILGMALVFRDMTQTLRAEADSIRLAAIVESSKDAIIGETLDGRITSWNHAAQEMFGYTAAEAVGQPVTMLIPPEHEAEAMGVLTRLAEGGISPEFGTIRRAKDGSLRDVSITVSPIKDAEGNVVGGSKIVRDLSRLRQAESDLSTARKLVSAERAARLLELEVSLHDKEVLLKEVHHRVKNNLQVISSLLQLQASHLHDAESLRVFEESRGRIRSMALVHEMLYQSEDMSHVDFSEYIRDLVSALAGSYQEQSARIKIDVRAEPVQLDIDRAIPCGLVLNELVTNSLKHGFPDGRTGRVHVHLSGGGDAEIVLRVYDDGIGWPQTFVPARSTSLGLQLVHILAKQLSASLLFEGHLGASCTLRLQPG